MWLAAGCTPLHGQHLAVMGWRFFEEGTVPLHGQCLLSTGKVLRIVSAWESPHHQAPRSLPRRDDDPLSLRNVPALESLAGLRSDFGRSWRNVPALEKIRRATSRLWRSGEKGRPAYLREHRRPPLPRGDDSLQRQDLAQTRAGFCVRKAGLSKAGSMCREPRATSSLWRAPAAACPYPSKAGTTRGLRQRNVTALEGCCRQVRQPLPSRDDVRSDAAYQPDLGEWTQLGPSALWRAPATGSRNSVAVDVVAWVLPDRLSTRLRRGGRALL